MVGSDQIPDHLLCPVCFELPVAEVYQCRDGHMLCRVCYFRLSECPQCRDGLDRNRPIRCRPIEEVLESLKIDCPFKSNGCEQKLSRRNAQNHQSVCCHDFDRFGPFVNICNNVGSPCDFKFNKGNTKEAVEHFVSEHGCILTTSRQFQMELLSFKPSAITGGNGYAFWTPIIADLKEKKCYLLTMAIMKKKTASFTWLSAYLPYPTNVKGKQCPVQVEYFVKTGGKRDTSFWTEKPLSLSDAKEVFPNKMSFSFYSPALIQSCSRDGSLLINCNVKQSGVTAPVGREREGFVCIKTDKIIPPIIGKGVTAKVLVRYDRNGGSSSAKKLRDKIKEECKTNRKSLLPALQNLFEGKKQTALSPEGVEWLKTDLIFVAAEFGTVESLKYLIQGGNCNIVDQIKKMSPLHYAICDKDKKIGLDKAKVIVDLGGADVHVLNDRKWSVLHYAAYYGSVEAVMYFLRKGCDVNATNKRDSTPLHFAVWNECEEEGLEIVKVLLANGADPEIKDDYGKTALEVALTNDKAVEKLQSLISIKQDI